MGYGAVKYADLRSHRTSNYRFSYDEMLALQVRAARALVLGCRTLRSCARFGSLECKLRSFWKFRKNFLLIHYYNK